MRYEPSYAYLEDRLLGLMTGYHATLYMCMTFEGIYDSTPRCAHWWVNDKIADYEIHTDMDESWHVPECVRFFLGPYPWTDVYDFAN